MLNILTGEIEICDMAPEKKNYLVQKRWRKMMQEKFSAVSPDLNSQQVTQCTEIAARDMDKRLKVVENIKRLNEKEKVLEQEKNDPRDKILTALRELTISKDSYYRVDDISMDLNILESGEEPCNLKLPLLQLITDNFSDKLKIGYGGCGAVYKGILQQGTIAVKKLFDCYTIDDKMFHQEVTSMMMVKHENIVRLRGYCSHTEEQARKLEGRMIMAQLRERLLCFEYISNGNLEDHITDELRGLEWTTRYQIITGICNGLHHLHAVKHIIHMDLKPANILLDEDMVPKITDFGLARLDDNTKTLSAERLLSIGYCAPEYLHHGKMSAKSDIYSLGIIILKIVTGSKEKPRSSKILRRWTHRWKWNKSTKDKPRLWYRQVKTCLDLAESCMLEDPTDRPTIRDVIKDLDKVDTSEGHILGHIAERLELEEDMLGIEPLEVHLAIEVGKQKPFSVLLSNETDDHFAFRISTTSLRPYFVQPDKDIVPPRSKCTATITLNALEQAPPRNYCKDEFTVHSTRVNGSVTATDISGGMFREETGKVVDKVNLFVFLDEA